MTPATLEEILAWHEQECDAILDYYEPQGDRRLQFIAGLKLAIAERVPKVTVKYAVQE